MNMILFITCLGIAVIAPALTLTYLRPILLKVLESFCDKNTAGAEFWMRSIYVLAIFGSLILMLFAGRFDESVSTVDSVRRALLVVSCAVFVSIALVTRTVWKQVQIALYGEPQKPVAPSRTVVRRSASAHAFDPTGAPPAPSVPPAVTPK